MIFPGMSYGPWQYISIYPIFIIHLVAFCLSKTDSNLIPLQICLVSCTSVIYFWLMLPTLSFVKLNVKKNEIRVSGNALQVPIQSQHLISNTCCFNDHRYKWCMKVFTITHLKHQKHYVLEYTLNNALNDDIHWTKVIYTGTAELLCPKVPIDMTKTPRFTW